jgi:hypothetical protein
LKNFVEEYQRRVSYQKAEIEVEVSTGIKVGHSTQQKLVLGYEFQLPY